MATIFSQQSSETLQAWGETGTIERIKTAWGAVNPKAPAGIGDDAATFRLGQSQGLITVDSVILGRHFSANTPAREAGRKLVNRNLSDIAAMGGNPRLGVLALFLDPCMRQVWFEDFLAGMAEAAAKSNLQLVGGDIAKGEDQSFIASLTVVGETDHPICRQGCRPGDTLWVTGSLGASFVTGHHLSFDPRIAEGQWLAQQPEIGGMIDLTDGLAKDLPSLLPGGYAALLNPERFPLRRKNNGEPTTWQEAMSDGEDYELLFSLCEGPTTHDFIERWKKSFTTPITCIGRVARDPIIDGLPCLRDAYGSIITLDPGYEHF